MERGIIAVAVLEDLEVVVQEVAVGESATLGISNILGKLEDLFP
jgi:hypothetical protein